MKKFMAGIAATLCTIGIGKLVYDKGRKDGVKEIHEAFSNVEKGIAIGEKSNKESE